MYTDHPLIHHPSSNLTFRTPPANIMPHNLSKYRQSSFFCPKRWMFRWDRFLKFLLRSWRLQRAYCPILMLNEKRLGSLNWARQAAPSWFKIIFFWRPSVVSDLQLPFVSHFSPVLVKLFSQRSRTSREGHLPLESHLQPLSSIMHSFISRIYRPHLPFTSSAQARSPHLLLDKLSFFKLGQLPRVSHSQPLLVTLLQRRFSSFNSGQLPWDSHRHPQLSTLVLLKFKTRRWGNFALPISKQPSGPILFYFNIISFNYTHRKLASDLHELGPILFLLRSSLTSLFHFLLPINQISCLEMYKLPQMSMLSSCLINDTRSSCFMTANRPRLKMPTKVKDSCLPSWKQTPCILPSYEISPISSNATSVNSRTTAPLAYTNLHTYNRQPTSLLSLLMPPFPPPLPLPLPPFPLPPLPLFCRIYLSGAVCSASTRFQWNQQLNSAAPVI